MTITSDDLVKREVFYCVSSLIETVASAYGMSQSAVDAEPHLWSLINQAAELTYPIDDYESAAQEQGWTVSDNLFVSHNAETTAEESSPVDACGWEDLCREFDIQPFSREVFEHWIVSDWLADKLEAKGEKVDRDFAGLIVWARTTTGQAIAQDYVVQQIAKELSAAGYSDD